MRLIFKSKRQVFDLEWVYLTKEMREEKPDDEDDEPEQDSDLSSTTQIAPDDYVIEDSVVPKARKIVGFRAKEK